LPGDRIIQEKIAQALGVSRQPVQQALNLLHNQGVLQDAPGRGLIVTVIVKGDADRAESLVRTHITQAATFMVARMRSVSGAEEK
jgi:DNA-binding GntR family transcriptional regulator